MNADRRRMAQELGLGPTAPALGGFPAIRMRRNRYDSFTRKLVAENVLSVGDLIWPIFIMEGSNTIMPVASMPGVVRVTLDKLEEHVAPAVKLGVPAVALFPMT